MRLALTFETQRIELELLETATSQVVAPGTVCFRRRLAAVKAGEGVRVEKV
jgi:hypothetical protein